MASDELVLERPEPRGLVWAARASLARARVLLLGTRLRRRMLFRLTPSSVVLSLTGHLIFGGVIGLVLSRILPGRRFIVRPIAIRNP